MTTRLGITLCLIVFYGLAVLAGRELYRFGYGGWLVWLVISVTGPAVIGVWSGRSHHKNLCPPLLWAALLSAVFNLSVYFGCLLHAYDFNVAHGHGSTSALGKAFNLPLCISAIVLAGIGPACVWAMQAAKSD